MINGVINRGKKNPKKAACIFYHNKLKIKLKCSVSESKVLLFVSGGMGHVWHGTRRLGCPPNQLHH